MVLRELFVKLGLSVDEASFAKGNLAAKAVAKAVSSAFTLASNAVGDLNDALIGFNARAEQAKMGLAGIAGMNLKLPWEEAKKAADELYKGLQEDAAKTPAETAELVDFSQQIAGAYLAAGKNMKDLRQFTTQAVVAAKMLKAEGTAATDIKQAIQGRVGVKDMFAANIINSLGMSIEEFNKKSMQERADLFAKGLNNPTIRAAMEEYEGQWDGVTSTLKDNIAIILGDVGKPLFKFLKQILGQIGGWVQKNREAITKTLVEPIRRLGAALAMVGGFLWQAGKGLSFWVEQMERNEKIVNVVLIGMLALQSASIRAAIASGAAWAKALLPFTLLYVILDDIRVFMNGGDSLLGDFVKWLDDISKPRDGDTWLVTQLKDFVRYIKEAIELLKDLDEVFGDGSKKRALLDRQSGAAGGTIRRNSDNQTLDAAKQRLAQGLPLTDAAKAALSRQGVTSEAFTAKYRPTARAPEFRAAAGGASVTAPVQISVTQAPGENGEDFAQRVGKVVTSFWDGQLEAAGAGVRR